MGFETAKRDGAHAKVELRLKVPYGIWNSYQLAFFSRVSSVWKFPMGFETVARDLQVERIGFESSLWDLKLSSSIHSRIASQSLKVPYGIWNKK